MAARLYRTFVQLDPHERWILRAVQHGIVMTGNKKPSLSKVIGAVVRAYWDDYEQNADPKMMAKLKKEMPPPAALH